MYHDIFHYAMMLVKVWLSKETNSGLTKADMMDMGTS